jgi:hypothetical protein
MDKESISKRRKAVNFKQLLKDKGWNMSRLSIELKVSYGTVLAWSKGAVPDFEHFLAVCVTLEEPMVPVAESLGYEDIVKLLDRVPVSTKNAQE